MPTFSANTQTAGQFTDTDYAFAKWLLNDIKRNQRLPLSLKEDDVFAAVANNMDWWYENCPYATEDDQLTINLDMVPAANKQLLADNPNLQLLTNEVLMPEQVYDLYSLYYATDGFWSGGQMTLAQWRLEAIMISSIAGVANQYGVDTYMASLFSGNLANSIDKMPVQFDYNRFTRKLKLYDKGTRGGYIICKVARKIQPSALYQDHWFRMYIMSHVINAKADQIELYGATLPGDLSVNIGVLRNRAEQLLDKVNEHMQAENDNDFYIEKT